MSTVAVFDDDRSIRDLLRDLLEGDGFRVIICESLLELHQAAVADAHVAIADAWGSSHDHLDAAERDQIRALARLIPTILVTGRTWAAREHANDLGLLAIVAKPFDVDDVLHQVRRVFGVGAPDATPSSGSASVSSTRAPGPEMSVPGLHALPKTC